ncbi:MAG: acetolactate synthase [Candidatus Ryanbacteria bacterium CG10_big_fil_rev_8_21_14_0_10_43_42]|uniref:Acetolactate synthase n=1 Tax=Candidatus Ryanbacteria bacterium CG10_big_fil_rev_8_21_14_0_10_43_42 TaxID=1974864 RepID=A0A2M8KXF4_9BACT|nr:MAG: acetolactate synthase [Candidatus Ryanbacteria bacterium CG10_big_fil_rev_8_21_14_0_10_43_42]
MKVADYIIDFFEKKGVTNAFVVVGGQAMFLDDAVYRSKKIKPIFTHHEQAAGMAADACSRLKNKPAIALVTAGPGAINVVNGVIGGWVDSSPMIILSGQTNLSFIKYQEESGIRQFGVQGINVRPLVERSVKFFVTVDDPKKILYYLQKAYYLATSGRPGPVWLDVPLNIQGAPVPDGPLLEFTEQVDDDIPQDINEKLKDAMHLLQYAKRPLILVGQGVRLGNAIEELNMFIDRVRLPVLTARLAIDVIQSNHPLYVGRPGTYGERAANFAIQNADVILSVGCRLGTSLIGHDAKDFGRNAKKIVIDIDQKELDKPGVDIAVKIRTTAKDFFQKALAECEGLKLPDWKEWISICKEWRKTYPVVLSSYKDEKPVNSYYFIDRLSAVAEKDDWVLVDTGSCFHVASQAWSVKDGQRFLTTGGISTMGYWVAGIGACMARDKKRVIVITGDGSLQMNLQEFATVKQNELPLKVFIFNNNGYLLMRIMQTNFMDKRFMGESPKTGLWCPDSLKIAEAYGIRGIRIDSTKGIDEKIKEILDYPGPVICDVMTPDWQILAPRTMSDKTPEGKLVARPYEDMYPFLDRDELKRQMIAELPDA